MTDQIFEIIDLLRQFHVPEALAIVGALLVLIDYFFPTDWPAHLGYVLFAASLFFVAYMYGLAPLWSLVASLVSWILLEFMHRLFFRELLENAPGTPGYDGGPGDASTADAVDPS
jgi:membrane protein implicated in regulation of membrane protease activity